MKITLETTWNYILLIPYEIPKHSNLVTNSNDTKCLGEVVNIHRFYSGHDLEESIYNEGDVLMYDIRKSQKYIIDGKEYIVVADKDVIARVKIDE